MPVVVDASIVLAPALEKDAVKSVAMLAAIQQNSWVVPALWWFEIRNVLVVNERRGRVTQQETERFLGRVSQTTVNVDDAPDEATVMALARRHRLTVYDAAYLELALREGVPLATLDAALAQAARREGVAVLE